MYKKLVLVLVFLNIFISACQLYGEVKGIEITTREIFADGQTFGSVGAYERIKGRLYYAVDPDNLANAHIVDLKLAPRNKDGLVEFVGDFFLLKPVDLTKGNHRILYDVNNRGRFFMLGLFNNAQNSNDPVSSAHAGNGFLMRQGYTLIWSAWNWDVRPSNNKMQIELPIITDNGKPITQKIAAEIVLSTSRTDVKSQPLAPSSSRCYPVVDLIDRSDAKLTVRDKPRGKRREIPLSQWRFARSTRDGTVVPDPTYLYIESGFESGKIYELIYEAKNPRVVGLGLASVRDAISFFRFETKDHKGETNPLVIRTAGNELHSDVEKVYIFGMSQSGRFIAHTIFEGFHVDESGRMVFDGANIHVAGGGKGGFNFRFAQTTHHPSHLESNYMPADFFPFNYTPQTDPITGRTGDVLAVAKKLGKIPYIMVTNNALEYWTRSASLIHTDVLGKKDANVHENVRIYMVNGAPHGNAGSRRPGKNEHSTNPLNHTPILRALLISLDKWVTDEIEPPASQYPRIDRKELLTAADHKRLFPKIPGMRHPGRNLQPPRVNYGELFWSDGIITVVPPEMMEPNITLVPNFDSDGNGIGGIRLPELQMPLGTYQGWNPRRKEIGAPNYLHRFTGSFWAFAKTEAERKQNNDPRLSLEERYENKETYVQRVRKAVQELIEQGFFLKEDGDIYIRNAQNIAWPPEVIDRYPFWKMMEK